MTETDTLKRLYEIIGISWKEVVPEKDWRWEAVLYFEAEERDKEGVGVGSSK